MDYDKDPNNRKRTRFESTILAREFSFQWKGMMPASLERGVNIYHEKQRTASINTSIFGTGREKAHQIVSNEST